MICYGCCVGPTGHFEELALPALSAIVEPSDRLLTVRDAKSITSAYNGLIDEARAMSDLEALVLLHDDVVLYDRNFAPRLRRVLRDPTVGVIGVAGASGLCNMSFWDGRTTKGRVWDGSRFLDFGPLRGDVDVVDGLLMVLSPAALDAVRFDETTFRGFHGYDVDYCLTCRKEGLRVVVEPFVLYHQSTGEMSSGSYTAAQAAFNQKWGGALSRPSALTKLFPDPIRRSEVRSELRATSADFGLAVRRGMDQGRTSAATSLQRARDKVSRHFGPPEPTGGNASNGQAGNGQAGNGQDGNGQDGNGQDSYNSTDRDAENEAQIYVAQSSEAESAAPRACLLCGQPMKETPGGLPLVSCERCQLLGTWPAPHIDDSSSDLFDLSYFGERSRRRAQWAHEARQRLAWIETWAPEGILLEVGSATGEFVAEAAAVGYEAIGVEPSKWAADTAQRAGAEVLCGTLADWSADYAGFTVDGVAMFHVLEHLEDPVDLLGQCRSVLAQDGRLFIEVPNASSDAAKSFDPSWVGWELGFHQWHYTPFSLQGLLGRAGLEILELREVTARVYQDRASWGRTRAENWSAGYHLPNMEYVRVVAGHAGRGYRAANQLAGGQFGGQ